MLRPSATTFKNYLQGSFKDFLERNKFKLLPTIIDNMLIIPGYKYTCLLLSFLRMILFNTFFSLILVALPGLELSKGSCMWRPNCFWAAWQAWPWLFELAASFRPCLTRWLRSKTSRSPTTMKFRFKPMPMTTNNIIIKIILDSLSERIKTEHWPSFQRIKTPSPKPTTFWSGLGFCETLLDYKTSLPVKLSKICFVPTFTTLPTVVCWTCRMTLGTHGQVKLSFRKVLM